MPCKRCRPFKVKPEWARKTILSGMPALASFDWKVELPNQSKTGKMPTTFYPFSGYFAIVANAMQDALSVILFRDTAATRV